MGFLPGSVPLLFFYVHANLEIHATGPELYEILDELEVIFPNCSTVASMRGQVYYHIRGSSHLVTYSSETLD